MVELQSTSGGWADLIAQNDTINIFGSGFGDLIQPTLRPNTLRSSCSQRNPVPDGSDYLVVPFYVLKDIALKHRRRKHGPISLSESIYWTDPDLCLNECDCARDHDRPCSVTLSKLQSLPISMHKRKCTLSQQDLFGSHLTGAAIFGQKPNRLKKKNAGKRKLDSSNNGVPFRNTRPRGSDSGVDVGISSSSGRAGSSDDAQQSLNDSAIHSARSV